MSAGDGRDPPGSGVTGALGRARKHPVVIVTLAVGTILAFVLTTTDQISRITGAISGWRNPHATEYAALATLDLDSRPEFFEDKFGRAKKSLDLCREMECPDPAPGSLRMYVHEAEGMTVRAIFEADSLEMYAVTLMDGSLSPPIRWLDHDLGELGTVTFAGALHAVPVKPTDAAVFVGPRSSAYAEVVAAGAPGRYRGLLLAWAPDGYAAGDLTFAAEAADALVQSDLREAPHEPATLARFRSGTTPNTSGEFRDDGGYVGTMLHDANRAMDVLYAGTEL